MIVGFTGTRLGPTIRQHVTMARVLISLFVNHGGTRFVHGGARGADTLAHHIVSANGLARQIQIDIFPSRDFGSVVAIPMGNSIIHEEMEPLARNKVIVSVIHGLIAVPATDDEQALSETWTTVRHARNAGCPIYIIQKSGRLIRDSSTEKWVGEL